jgi:hypothetical protein
MKDDATLDLRVGSFREELRARPRLFYGGLR